MTELKKRKLEMEILDYIGVSFQFILYIVYILLVVVMFPLWGPLAGLGWLVNRLGWSS